MRLVIASRKSDLARIQAYQVGDTLKTKFPGLEIDYHFRESLGDINQQDPLWKMPERGVFTEDFHQGLLGGEFDLVVHSWKDLPVEDRQGTAIVATLPREDMRDVLLFKKKSLRDADVVKILTSSPRRTYNLSRELTALLPVKTKELRFEAVRGNVPTRIQKLIDGDCDGLVVAKAALDRLLGAQRAEFQPTCEKLRSHLSLLCWMVLPLSLNPTAAAQGALAVEIRSDREDLKKLLGAVHCESTFRTVTEERRLLRSWGGGCHQKIGVNVMERPYGRLTWARGVRDSGEIIDINDLQLTSPVKMAGGGFPVTSDAKESAKWFEREAIAWEKPRETINAHWVSKAEALPESVKPGVDELVWTGGLRTWKQLAERGIWVNGSTESLGEHERTRTEILDSRTRRWAKWTHQAGESAVQGPTLRTYRLVPRSQRPALDESINNFYWMSGSSFKEALKHNPWLLNKQHWCGPGHTLETIERELKQGQGRGAVHIALDFKQWQKNFKG